MQVPSFRSIALRLQDNLCFILKLQHLEIFVRSILASILASKVAYKNQERNFWVAYSAEGRQVDDVNGKESAGRSHSLPSSSEATGNFRDIVDAVIRKRKYAGS